MKKLISFLAILIMLQSVCEARSGGGGRGGGGGGPRGGGGGRSMSVQRGPSMSRASPQRPAARPNIAQNRPNVPRQNINPSQLRQPVDTARLNQMRQNQPNRNALRSQAANNIRNNSNYPALENRFQRDIGNRYDRNLNWRNAAAWSAAAGWIGANASYPYYYDSGYYYPYDTGYYPTDTTAYTAPVVTPQTNLIIAGGQASTPEQGSNWLPLGIYGLTTDGSASVVNMYLQLAMNKQGVISGTFYNQSTNNTQPLEGMVDQQSQTVTIRVANRETPVLQTGLYNLTQAQAPVRLTFSNGQSQDWLLVRMQ